MKDSYEDIIGMEHPTSKKHKRMSLIARSAQFSPFAALTGYDDLIRESERDTDSRIILDEDRKEELNLKLVYLIDNEEPADFIIFENDETKEGGSYVKYRGSIKKYDEIGKYITLDSRKEIFIDDIYDIL